MKQGTTKSMEDFLEALLMLEEKNEPLETTRVAKLLGISKPAVHQMGHELIDRGYITRVDYGPMTLTKQGRDVAQTMLHRHRTLKKFLMNLGVSEEVADHDGCEIEHAISAETFAAIEQAVKN